MLKAYVTLVKIRKDGKILKKRRRKLSRSFLSNFIRYYYSVGGDYTTPFVNTVGAVKNDKTNSYGRFFRMVSGNGECVFFSGGAFADDYYKGGDFGIVLGTGTNAVTPIDHKLQTPILHGTGAGEMEYLSGFNPQDITVSGSDAYFDVERMCLNSSGGSITVNEIGVYATADFVTNGDELICIIRDIVSPGLAVADGEYLKATYRIQISI